MGDDGNGGYSNRFGWLCWMLDAGDTLGIGLAF